MDKCLFRFVLNLRFASLDLGFTGISMAVPRRLRVKSAPSMPGLAEDLVVGIFARRKSPEGFKTEGVRLDGIAAMLRVTYKTRLS